MNRLHTDGMSSMLAALLQQVMQLTPEQIAGLPQDQQAQVLALQQHMVRTNPSAYQPCEALHTGIERHLCKHAAQGERVQCRLTLSPFLAEKPRTALRCHWWREER